MKTIILTLTFTLTSSKTITLCSSQKMEMKKTFSGYVFFMEDGERISKQNLKKTLEPNKIAFDLFKNSRTKKTVGSILEFSGGFLIGFPIGQAISYNPEYQNWSLAGIGGGLVIIGTIFSLDADKKTKRAVEIYNSSLDSASHYKFESDFEVIANRNGIGLLISF